MKRMNKKYLVKIGEIVIFALAIFCFIYSGMEIYKRSGEARDRLVGIFMVK